MKQTWTVYTAEGDEVIATRWTEQGPQAPKSVVKIAASAAEAAQRAVELQRGYDKVRNTLADR